MRPELLQLDVLRTFVVSSQVGSFKQAARVVGRTQAAISMQMQKLQHTVGAPLFERHGRSLTLTPAGELLLSYSRRLLALNDEAIEATAGLHVQGRVRLGLLQDFAETILPPVLAPFSKAHPRVDTEVLVDRSSVLLDKLARQELDLVLMFGKPGPLEGIQSVRLAKAPMVWVTPPGFQATPPVKLVTLPPPCIFREAALKNLGPRCAWRQSFTTPSLSGLWAAVAAGLGISVRTTLGLPAALSAVRGFGERRPLPAVDVSLVSRAHENELVARLRRTIAEAVTAGFQTAEGSGAKTEARKSFSAS